MAFRFQLGGTRWLSKIRSRALVWCLAVGVVSVLAITKPGLVATVGRCQAQINSDWQPITLDGNSWPASEQVAAFWSFGVNDIWAVGSAVGVNARGRRIYRYSDIGGVVAWRDVTPISLRADGYLIDVWGAAGNLWAVGDGVYHYDGANWNRETAVDNIFAATAERFAAVWGDSPSRVWVGGSGETASLVMFDGANWSRPTINDSLDGYDILDIRGDPDVDPTFWAIAQRRVGGTITINNLTGQEETTGATIDTVMVTWNGATGDVASGGLENLNTTLGDPSGWSNLSSATSSYRLWFASPSDQWLTRPSRSRVYIYPDQATAPPSAYNVFRQSGAFGPVVTPSETVLRAIDGASVNEAWAVGNTILHWDGAAWREDAVIGNLNAVLALGSSDIWVAGLGKMYHRLTAPATPATCLITQSAYNGVKTLVSLDQAAMVDSADPDRNFGDVGAVVVGNYDANPTLDGLNESYGLIHFPVDQLPVGARQILLTLPVYLATPPTPDNAGAIVTVTVKELANVFNPQTVTWNNQPAVVGDIDTQVIEAQSLDPVAAYLLVLDVTTYVKAVQTGAITNTGLSLRAITADPTGQGVSLAIRFTPQGAGGTPYLSIINPWAGPDTAPTSPTSSPTPSSPPTELPTSSPTPTSPPTP